MVRASPSAFRVDPYDLVAAQRLRESLGVSDPIAATLVRRGYDTPDSARSFLAADESHDPFEFDSMEEIVARVLEAVASHRRVTVHGDYDVDGVCSTAILVAALRDLGAECDWYLPSRLDDGYGLTATGVERLARRGTQLLLTADCGITCVDEVALAQARGIEVIVSDHHEPGPELPRCPILHPRLSGYPFGELCATGVAYKLALALRERGGADAGDLADDLDLVALATVADLVPLEGENRALVRAGLAEARRARRPGLRALMAVARVDPAGLDEGDLSFRLAPRINAAGRLQRADAGVELMLTGDPERAQQIAEELDSANHQRREVEREALTAAETAARALPGGLAGNPALVVAGEDWHPGVVGIVASRLVDAHWRPAIVIGIGPDGQARGSGRSVPGFNLLAGLEVCGAHLVRYGGHAAAAGLEIEASRIEDFRSAFCEYASGKLDGLDTGRTERIDAVVGGDSLGIAVAEELERLRPFGMGNPEVRLLVPSARVRHVQPMGEEGKHARFSLQSGQRRATGVAFGVNGDLAGAGDGPLDLSLKLELNAWNGTVEPRVVLGSVFPLEPLHAGTEPSCSSPAPAREWWLRFERELAAPTQGAPIFAGTRERREALRSHDCSPVALLAGLLSAGVPVLAVCADALRRRGLVERAVAPGRFGGGVGTIACGRCGSQSLREHPAQVLAAGRGLVLADWAALSVDPSLPEGFENVVLVDPAPSPDLEALAFAGRGRVHLCWGPGELELARQLHELDWAPRKALAALYASLRDRDTALEGDSLLEILAGRGPFPLTPEQAARRCRVLLELGLLAKQGTGPTTSLRVVSSEMTDLERSGAFRAYRARSEEGQRFLESRRAPR